MRNQCPWLNRPLIAGLTRCKWIGWELINCLQIKFTFCLCRAKGEGKVKAAENKKGLYIYDQFVFFTVNQSVSLQYKNLKGMQHNSISCPCLPPPTPRRLFLIAMVRQQLHSSQPYSTTFPSCLPCFRFRQEEHWDRVILLLFVTSITSRYLRWHQGYVNISVNTTTKFNRAKIVDFMFYNIIDSRVHNTSNSTDAFCLNPLVAWHQHLQLTYINTNHYLYPNSGKQRACA